MDTYESAMIYLNAMKDDGRLMFGSLKKAIMLERSYLLIINNGKVETNFLLASTLPVGAEHGYVMNAICKVPRKKGWTKSEL